MGDIILNNMVFNASAPNVGDRCLLIQNGNTKYAIPLAYIDNSSDSSNTSSMPNESMNFYKCASVDTTNRTWTGYKLIPNVDNGYSLASIESLVGEYYIQPTVGGIYDQTCKIKLMSYYEGDNVDPYGDGLLYRIFVNGGTAWSAPAEGAETTDNYTSNVETVYGITARKFNGSERVTATASATRTTWSYSVWLYGAGGRAIIADGLLGLKYDSGRNTWGYVEDVGGNFYDYVSGGVSHWNHFVVTYNNSQWKTYLNGTLNKSHSTNLGTHSKFIFGGETTGNPGYYTGYIANFRFYDHVLSASEIEALYEELTPSNN